MARVAISRILIIGYNTLDQAKAKGLIDDNPDSCNVWYNPGNTFEKSCVFVPFGKHNKDIPLSKSIRYIEWQFIKTPRLVWPVLFAQQITRALKFLSKLVSDEKIQVMRANGPHVPAMISCLLRLSMKIPAVLFIEAFWERLLATQAYMPRSVRFLLPLWYRLVYRSFDVYCGTPSVDPEYFVSRGMDRRKISEWAHELDLETLFSQAGTFDSSCVDNLPRPRMVAVGRLHPEKHPGDLVKVLALVRRFYPETQLVLVGDGQSQNAVMKEASILGISDAVTITGTLQQGHGVKIVMESDIYLAPLQGNALVEAMAAGKPIVAYDHATHSNLLHHNKTAILVPYRDTAAMAQGVIRLLGDPNFAVLLGSAAREAAFKEHSRDIVVAKLRQPFEAAWVSAK